jgi:hypothetical protein
VPPNAGVVLDTSAIVAYTTGSDVVGGRVSAAADEGLRVVIPATCLATAYQQVPSDGWGLLDILGTLPQVVVAPLEHDMCAFLGGWARSLGLDLAHAAMESAAFPPVPLITDQRDRVTAILPKEWPIIEL